jgi:hypothetical protein
VDGGFFLGSMAAAGFARMVLLKKKRVRKEEGKQDYLGRNKGAGRGRKKKGGREAGLLEPKQRSRPGQKPRKGRK